MSAERWVREWWRGDAGGTGGTILSALLVPAEALFRAGAAVRSAAYDRAWLSSSAAAIPVLSVGNLTVGGTGKTPLSAWIVRRLIERGERPALVSRGYGEDEARLHERWNPDALRVSAPNRVSAVAEAAAGGATVAVLDDGFQHRAIRRDADIVLIAAEESGPVRLLPRGPYREPLAALDRADLVVFTRKTGRGSGWGPHRQTVERMYPSLPVTEAELRPGRWLDQAGNPCPAPEGRVLAICSVADPESFRRTVEEALEDSVELVAYPDHHPYSSRDLDEIVRRAGERPIVTTEKDAVKWPSGLRAPGSIFVLGLDVRFASGIEALDAVVESALERRGREREG